MLFLHPKIRKKKRTYKHGKIPQKTLKILSRYSRTWHKSLVLVVHDLIGRQRSMFTEPDPVYKELSELLELMGMLCSRCNQQLPTTEGATTVQCRACNTVNEISKPEQLNSANRSRIGGFFKVILMNKIIRPLTLNVRHSSSSSTKRALLVGVSYNNNKNYILKGTVNDVKHMKNLLIDNFCYKAENIRILTEEENQKSDLKPTKTNIQKNMRWLVDGIKPGDSLVFYFSGHGVRLPDFDGEESDGMDESICPLDFNEEGMILDDEIYSTIVTPLMKGVTLHGIIDACHSGTILDLQYVYNTNEKKWKENNKKKQDPNGGLAISISACQDSQVAADTDAFSVDKKVNGAMTYILQEIVRKHKDISYAKLINQINKLIAEANQQGCLPARIVRKMFRYNWFLQTPQLSASEPFDVENKPFLL